MEHAFQDIYEMHTLVKGKVQGVGFRALTRYHALNLGLKGTVCNLSDGTVEIYAQGSKEGLEALIQKLKEEMGPSQIEHISIEYFPVKQSHENFRIIHKI